MEMPLDVAGGQRTCGMCSHWVRIVDPSNIGQAKGECRAAPPSLTLLPRPGGALAQLCGYPPVGPNFPACGQWAQKRVDIVLSEEAA